MGEEHSEGDWLPPQVIWQKDFVTAYDIWQNGILDCAGGNKLIRIIAHRGASSECRENSLAAFERAILLGAHQIELDLHLSKDSVAICHHDPELKGGYPIEEMTAQEIQARDPEIPTLQEILAINRKETGLMIELKRGGDPGRLIATVLPLLQAGDLTVGSLCPEMVGLLAKRWPLERLVAIVESDDLLERHLAHQSRTVSLCYRIASKDRIAAWRAEGREVALWTVDDPGCARHYAEWGVDAIITNDPRGISQALTQAR